MMPYGKIRHVILLVLLLIGMNASADDRQMLFNDAWRFHRGEQSAAMHEQYDDTHWQMVDLPHDWRMAPDSLNLIDELADTVGWYRKTFTILPSDTGKRVLLCFERIHGRADIWVNGQLAYRAASGYVPIKMDVTPYLHAPLVNNTITIRVSVAPWDRSVYRGAGVTHDTWLMKLGCVHFEEWETAIKTNRVYSRRGRWYAELLLNTLIRHTGISAHEGDIRIRIVDPDGKNVYNESHSTWIADSTTFTTKITLRDPKSWYAETPEMYHATLYIGSSDGISDSITIPFGIITTTYSEEMGLLVNDETPLIQGSTLNYNARLTGYTAFRRAEALLVEHMQTNGYTAVRCPMGLLSEHFLTACDTLGVMVLADAFSPIHPDEDWSEQATAGNVKRFRNHPSIVMWCVADSINEAPVVSSADSHRPIATNAMLKESVWSYERSPIGDRTPYAYQLDAERLVSSITLGISAPDTTRNDSTVWLPEVQRWTWPGYEGDTMRINIYSRNDWVNLYLNDKFMGNAKPDKHTHQVVFYVPYTPGKIYASTNFDMRRLWRPKKPKSKIKLSGRFNDYFRLFTEGEPKHLYLSTDRTVTSYASGELCFVKIEVLDADGNILPDAEIPLTLHIRGPGLIVAAGNGHDEPSSLHSLKTYQGSALVVIRPFRAVGTIRLTVRPEGIEAKDITIKVF